MKAIRNGRTLFLSDLPAQVEGLTVPTEYSIEIRLAGDESRNRLGRGVSLDNIVIPLILRALNEG